MSIHYVLKIQYVNKPPETRNISARVTTLGREAGDIVLGDPQSSGRHAEIHFENGNLRVKDLGSTNGTFFNGARTPEFTMNPGEGFSIGQTVMTLMAVHGVQPRAGAGKTMIAMGGAPPRPPGPPGAPPMGAPPRPPGPPGGFGAPPGPPPGPPAGFGAPPNSPGFGAPPGPPPGGGFGGPPPGPPPGGGFGAPPGPPQGGFGGPPPGPPAGGFGGPPPGPPAGGFGGPPPGPPAGGFGGPPPGPPAGGFGGPPPGGFGGPPPGPPQGGFGGPPPAMAPAAAAFGASMSPATQSPPPQQFGGPPQQQFGGPSPMASASPGGEIRGDFSGTGGELFGQLFVGLLLTMITFGIYMPWFQCKLLNFMAQRITFGPTSKGTVRATFDGQGGDLFVLMLVNGILVGITFGIYMPWYVCKLYNWMASNVVIKTDSGEEYRATFDGQGGELFVTYLVGAILTGVTFGIYMPWFMCNITKWIFGHVKIHKNGQEVGGLEFVGEGGDLFHAYLIGAVLTMVTFGIYMPWFQCKILAWQAEGTKINIEGKRVGLRFSGQGGELFVIGLVGGILMMLTLGIHYFWFITKLLKWQLSNLVIQVEGGAPMQMGAPMGGGQFGQPQQNQMYGQPPQGQIQGGFGQPPQQQYGGPPQGGGYA